MNNGFTASVVAALLAAFAVGMSPEVSAITVNDIADALDNPQGVVFTAPGQFKGSTSAWTKATGTIPKDPKQVDGAVTMTGSSCLVAKAPTTATGYVDYMNLRSRNYITLKVQGTGRLSFNYRTSLDDNKDAKLMVYEYDGDNSKALLVDYYDTPTDELNNRNMRDPEDFFEHMSASGSWDKYDPNAWIPSWLTGAEFWERAEIDLEPNKYTHELVIAVVGNALYESDGSRLVVEADMYTDMVLENQVYLDKMVWEPITGELVPKPIVFSHESGTLVPGKLEVTLSSDYNDDVFDFYYTLDGSEPTTRSPKFDHDDVNQQPIVIDRTCTLRVLAVESDTGAKVYDQASYTLKPLPAPTIVIRPSETTLDSSVVFFQGDYVDFEDVNFCFTVGNDPTLTCTGSQRNYFEAANDQLEGRTITVKAFVGNNNSDPTTLTFQRARQPSVAWRVDGAFSDSTRFYNQVHPVVGGYDDTHLVIKPGNALTADGTFTIFAYADNTLASVPITRSFMKVADLATGNLPLLLGYEPAAGSKWALFAMPGEILPEFESAFMNWLRPWKRSGNSYSRATALKAGEVCWIQIDKLDFAAAPQGVLYRPSATPDPDNGWQLVPTGADWIWDGVKFVPNTENSTAPGWKKR